jgi:hypothetical protein
VTDGDGDAVGDHVGVDGDAAGVSDGVGTATVPTPVPHPAAPEIAAKSSAAATRGRITTSRSETPGHRARGERHLENVASEAVRRT